MLNLCMTGMDGLEVLWHPRQDERTATIPVIAVTGVVEEPLHQQLSWYATTSLKFTYSKHFTPIDQGQQTPDHGHLSRYMTHAHEHFDWITEESINCGRASEKMSLCPQNSGNAIAQFQFTQNLGHMISYRSFAQVEFLGNL